MISQHPRWDTDRFRQQGVRTPLRGPGLEDQRHLSTSPGSWWGVGGPGHLTGALAAGPGESSVRNRTPSISLCLVLKLLLWGSTARDQHQTLGFNKHMSGLIEKLDFHIYSFRSR